MKTSFLVALSAVGLMVSSQASAVIIADNYWGADGFSNYADRDRIGDARYEIYNMEVTFTDVFMNVKVNTNFVNSTTNRDPYGVNYGDLFISTDGWNPAGTAADHYRTDTALNGEDWEYVFDTSAGALYGDGFTTLNSSAFFSPAQYIFRNGPQEVQRGSGGTQLSGSSVNLASAGTGGFIEYNILLTSLNFTGGDIGLRWQMTCANDVIEGAVNYSVPEPSTVLMMGMGLLGLVAAGRKRAAG